MSDNDAAEHQLTGGDEVASCLCGDWHPVTFYLAAERRATVERIRERLLKQAELSGKDVQAMEGSAANIGRGHFENDYGDYLRGYRTAALDNAAHLDAVAER